MRPGRVAYITCPRCRAINEHGMVECFLCEMRLAGLSADPPADSGPRFRLATLMVVIALVAMYLALWRASAGLAALMLVPGSIATVRAFLLRGERYGRPPSTWEYVGAFVVTFGFVVLVMASSVVAFFVTCFAIVAPTGNVNSALIFSLIAAVVAPVVLLVVAARRRGTRFHGNPHSGRRK